MPAGARRAVSKRGWENKKWAIRDAAFEAYLALHKLHDPLVNHNLLPLFQDAKSVPDKRPRIAFTHETMDPWAAMDWNEGSIIYSTPITLKTLDRRGSIKVDILTLVKIPTIDNIPIHWAKATEIGQVIVGESECLGVDWALILRAKKMTYELLYTVFRTKMQTGVTDFPYLFLWKDKVEEWDVEAGRTTNALEAYTSSSLGDDIGIIRDITQEHPCFVFRRWRTDVSLPDDEKIIERYGNRPINPSQPVIEATRLTSRRDFLHETAIEDAPETTVLLLPEYCTIDKVPWSYSQFALFLPGVIHRIEMALIASNLQHTLLAPVNIQSTSRIATALSTPSAREPTNYQRFEFLGDSVLKFLTAVVLMDEHPSWHEGILTAQKAKMISNTTLAKAAQDLGLAKWIITDAFTGLKWSPRYITPEDGRKDELPALEKRLPTKVLADVIEALIGAAYVEGGYEKALKCISTLGLGVGCKPLRARIDSLAAHATSSPAVNVPHLQDLEKLIGYKFKHQALLIEAITHPSCESVFPSYQRMEFLGDALLDMVVLDELFPDPKQLLPADMHLLKSAAVNGNLLAFLSLGCSTNVERPKVEQLRGDTIEFQVRVEDRKVNLWQFVHLSHPEMAEARKGSVQRYENGLQDNVQAVLETGLYYPWTELSPLEADTHGKNKLLSDIVEAIIGAVFVDSGGDFESVKSLAEVFGVLKVLKRLVKDDVNLMHPLNRLAETVARMHNGAVLYVETIEDGEHVYTIWFDGEELATAKSSCQMESKAMAAELGLKALSEKVERYQMEKVRNKAEVRLIGGGGADVEMNSV